MELFRLSLVVKIGEPNKVISEFIKEHNINCIYFQDEWTEKKIVRKDCY